MELLTPSKLQASSDMFQSHEFWSESDQCATAYDSDHEISEDDNSNPQHYGFTPKRAKKLPRAWERKPATPFAPRNEAQKIWKRVPLTTMNTNTTTWRKGGDQEEGMRTVKRLRTTNPVVSVGKENAPYVGMKWDLELTTPRRRNVSLIKSANILHSNASQGFAAVNSPSIQIGEVAKAVEAINYTADDMEILHAEEEDDIEVDDLDGVEEDDEEEQEQELEESILESIWKRSAQSPENSDSIIENEELEEVRISPSSSPARIQEPQSSPTTEVLDAEQETLPLEDQVELVIESPVIKSHTTPLAETDSTPIASKQKTYDEDQVEGISFDISSEISRPSCIQPQMQAVLQTWNTAAENEDDTAFLHAFLSRARAQKEAKVKPPSSPKESYQSPAKQQQDMLIPEPEAVPAEISDPILAPESEQEAKVSSPCRRSSRITTRLPRPQRPATTLPSNISLKRLNGTEFISMQKETQSLALATRANTKKNKGEAIPVSLKLLQLHAEPWCEPTENPAKKRKRGKEVSWDEKLARYQGDEDTVIDENSTEAEVKTEVKTTIQPSTEEEKSDGQEEKKQARKVRKLRKMNVGTVNGTPAPKKTIPLLLGIEGTDNVEETSVPQEKRPRTRSCR